ncbi:hypothetical protein SCARD494_05669 [Seiridium cardinale]
MNSEDLAICWSLDPTRLGLSNGTEVVEVGMNLSTIGSALTPSYDFSSHAVLQEGCGGPCGLIYTSGGWKTNVSSESIWDYFGILSGSQNVAEQSENFKAIRAYALTAQLLKMSLQPSTWVLLRYSWYIEPDDWTDATNAKVSVQYVDGWSRTLNETVRILGYETPEQGQDPEQTHNDSLTVCPFPYNETGLEKVSWVNLTLNSSTPIEWKDLRSKNLHYNSTLKYNNSSFHLPSPFLDVGYGCSGNTKFSTLGNCICYKRKPISLDLLSDYKAVCKTAPGYVWGFSSRLTVLGMALEATWMGCCFIPYVYLSIRCKCIRNDAIKTAGTLKLAMDLTESVQRDIGGHVTFMTEEKAKEELKAIRIGYKPETLASNQIARYRLVSSPPDKTAKKRFSEGLGAVRNWGLKHNLNFETACERMLALKTNCKHPQTKDEYVKAVVGGVNNSPENATVTYPKVQVNGFTHAFIGRFDNEEDRAYYIRGQEKDPAHLSFVESIKDILDKHQVIDFTPGVF